MTHPGTPESADAPLRSLAGPSVARELAAAAAGEQPGGVDGFTAFYQANVIKLMGYLVYQGAAMHVAADITQETMIAVFERWSQVTSPKAYAYKVAYRAFIRHALRECELLSDEVPEAAALLPQPDEAERWLQEQQTIQILRALPPRQRQVFALTIDGWAQCEIAEMLEITPETVRSNLKKARRAASDYRRSAWEEAP